MKKDVKLYRGKFEAYQRTYVLTPNDEKNLFLLFYVVENSIKKLAQGASGSTIKFLTKGMIEGISMLFPSAKLLSDFNSACEEAQTQIEVLQKKAKLLCYARERLLPKLMSGEVEV